LQSQAKASDIAKWHNQKSQSGSVRWDIHELRCEQKQGERPRV